jgi:hypothetical protein
MISMATEKEYQEWLNDPVAQQEYSEYLTKEAYKTNPKFNEIINHFTKQFDEIFKEKL